MHSCIAIITKEFPTDDVLDEILEPYNEERFYEEHEGQDIIPEEDYPKIMYDYWVVGGRYGGALKLKIDEKDEEYKWQFYAKEPRAGRLFRSNFLEMLNRNKPKSFYREEDSYSYIGFCDGFLYVDGCKAKDVIDLEDTLTNHNCALIGKDGTVYARSWWNGNDFVEDEQYEEKVKEAIKDIDDCYVCYVDIHD